MTIHPKHAALFALPTLLLTGAAQAAVQYVAISATAPLPITQVGPVPVLPFDLAPQNAIAGGTMVTTIPGMPSPGTGSLTMAPAGRKLMVGSTTPPNYWNQIWANGYVQALYFVNTTSATLTLPPRTTAFHTFASPNNFASLQITATSDSGVTSGAVTVTGTLPPAVSLIPGFGFYTTTPGEAIQSIALQINDAGGMGIALFGIAQAPDSPQSLAATAGPGKAALSFTAPTDIGTHPITAYTASCTPQGGGAAITGSGPSSPLTLSGLTNGTAYDCTVAATSAAGTGPASALASVTPAPLPLAITTTALPDGQVGTSYALLTLASTGGTAPMSWSATGLPAGMSLSAAGDLSGTPTAAGSYPVVITVTDTSAPTALTQTVTLNLAVADVPVVAPAAVMPVPTLGTWALGLLGLLTAALTARVRRRT